MSEKKFAPGQGNANDTLGIGLGNDTIGDFKGMAIGPGANKLDQTGGANDTLNFYVSALKKEENQRSETGGEEYMDPNALDGKKKGQN